MKWGAVILLRGGRSKKYVGAELEKFCRSKKSKLAQSRKEQSWWTPEKEERKKSKDREEGISDKNKLENREIPQRPFEESVFYGGKQREDGQNREK